MGHINRRLQADLDRSVAELKKLRQCNAGLVKMIADLVTTSLSEEVESRALFRGILQLAAGNLDLPAVDPPPDSRPPDWSDLPDGSQKSLRNEGPTLNAGDLILSATMTPGLPSFECLKTLFHLTEGNEKGISWARRSPTEED